MTLLGGSSNLLNDDFASGFIVEREDKLIIERAKVNIATTHSNSISKEMTVEWSFGDVDWFFWVDFT